MEIVSFTTFWNDTVIKPIYGGSSDLLRFTTFWNDTVLKPRELYN